MSKKEKPERMEKAAHSIFDAAVKNELAYEDFAVVIGFVVGSLPFGKKTNLKHFIDVVKDSANVRAATLEKEAK